MKTGLKFCLISKKGKEYYLIGSLYLLCLAPPLVTTTTKPFSLKQVGIG
jgi:hypothetical protein